jgi:hypothetical protein
MCRCIHSAVAGPKRVCRRLVNPEVSRTFNSDLPSGSSIAAREIPQFLPHLHFLIVALAALWQKSRGSRCGRPKGCGGTGPICFVAAPLRWSGHRIRRRASHLAPWRSQRGPRDFCHGLLEPIFRRVDCAVRTKPSTRYHRNLILQQDSLYRICRARRATSLYSCEECGPGRAQPQKN